MMTAYEWRSDDGDEVEVKVVEHTNSVKVRLYVDHALSHGFESSSVDLEPDEADALAAALTATAAEVRRRRGER